MVYLLSRDYIRTNQLLYLSNIKNVLLDMYMQLTFETNNYEMYYFSPTPSAQLYPGNSN